MFINPPIKKSQKNHLRNQFHIMVKQNCWQKITLKINLNLQKQITVLEEYLVQLIKIKRKIT